MCAALTALGIQKGQLLMVHSSLRSLGQVEGGAASVIEALERSVGPDGTLMMPGLSYESVTREQPYFSQRETPVCVGVIPETFRKSPGVVRSLHPTHSVCAWGRRARELTAAHGLDTTPVGANSPFRRLAQEGGRILMLGCGLRPNTFMHGVEEAACAPYPLQKEPVVYTLEDEHGAVREAAHLRHDFSRHIQRYDRVAEVLAAPALTEGRVLAARVFLIDAAKLMECGIKKIREEPYFFVDCE